MWEAILRGDREGAPPPTINDRTAVLSMNAPIESPHPHRPTIRRNPFPHQRLTTASLHINDQ